MKKWVSLAAALALLLTLSACALLVRDYETVEPHTDQRVLDEDENALTAQNYLSLKNAILSFVQNGVENGVIRVYDYSGSVEEDLAKAAYEVSKNDPLGAYAVDYMTHDCVLIVSYYEIHIDITFRRTTEQIQRMQRASSMTALSELIGRTMASYGQELAVRMSYYNGQDVETLVREYYAANPATAMELPEVTVNIYPDSGYVRVVELLFQYQESAEALQEKQDAVATSLRAAEEYVRYRDTDAGKLQLLYKYLQERFSYEQGDTATPVYSFLCDGVADSEGCAKALQLICDRIGLECHTVEGNRGGEPYSWNIVGVDGVFCHADLLRSLMEDQDMLTLYQDGAMTDYYWDAEAYPQCP